MMRDSHKKYVKVVLNLLTALAGLLVLIFAVPRVVGFFMPFVIGWIVAAVANPLVRFLDEKLRIRRKAGSAIVIVSVIAAIVGLSYWGISLLVRQAVGFVEEIPQLWASLEQDVNHAGTWLESFSKFLTPQLQGQIENITSALSGFVSNLVNDLGSPTAIAVGNLAKNIPTILVGTIMCLLSSYFFVAQREEVLRFLHRYVPEDFRAKWAVMYRGLTGAVGGYFKAQLKIEVWMYLLLLIGFLILRVRYSVLIALVIAALDFLPVFGTGAVLWPWAVIKLLGGDFKMTLGLLILWGVGQLARQLIQPKIVGDSIGVPALPTLFLLFIGYKMGSVAGMILAVPVGIIIAKMYQAGFFDTTIDSVRILVHGFNRFRRLTDEDKKDLPGKKE
ncbi:MAG: sporulation integral membrane protein YtvI [Eubacteriales bacterium]|nr:sporulation integral membrane protein YtvI [Eubacteriales bacterium]